MAIPGGSLTTTSSISNLVQAAYDQYVRMALRSIPVMRSLADVKPVQQAMPGSSVVFSIYSDLAQATSTLTESSDVSSIALGNPSQVTVTLSEYGSAVSTTKKLNLTSFNDVDSALADIIAYNAADSIDNVVGQVLCAGTQALFGTGGTTNPTSSATVLPVDTISTADIRNAVVTLRTNKALPRIGELYAAYLHPRQSADLRAESGTGGFQELTKYVERTPFTAGAVGVLEGAFVVETPRVLNGLKLAAGLSTTTTITNVALTSNVATITTAVAHGLGVGQVVAVAAVTATTVNDTAATITAVTSTTFSYAKTASNVTSAADTGTVTFTNNYRAIIAGREALAEAQAADISTIIGPEIDALRRFRTIGWYYFGGFNRLREAALVRIESAASNG
jgi:N4-gp56 family major capsid protein